MYLEYDLCEPTGAEIDMDRICQGKAILVLKTPEMIRLIEWTDGFVTPSGMKLGPGFQAVDYLRSEDSISDTDIVIDDIRYCTQSGVSTRAFFPDREEFRVNILRLLYRRLGVRVSLRSKFKNRITEILD